MSDQDIDRANEALQRSKDRFVTAGNNPREITQNDTNAVDRDWIAAELLKIADAERALATEAKARAATPPA